MEQVDAGDGQAHGGGRADGQRLGLRMLAEAESGVPPSEMLAFNPPSAQARSKAATGTPSTTTTRRSRPRENSRYSWKRYGESSLRAPWMSVSIAASVARNTSFPRLPRTAFTTHGSGTPAAMTWASGAST